MGKVLLSGAAAWSVLLLAVASPARRHVPRGERAAGGARGHGPRAARRLAAARRPRMAADREARQFGPLRGGAERPREVVTVGAAGRLHEPPARRGDPLRVGPAAAAPGDDRPAGPGVGAERAGDRHRLLLRGGPGAGADATRRDGRPAAAAAAAHERDVPRVVAGRALDRVPGVTARPDADLAHAPGRDGARAARRGPQPDVVAGRAPDRRLHVPLTASGSRGRIGSSPCPRAAARATVHRHSGQLFQWIDWQPR